MAGIESRERGGDKKSGRSLSAERRKSLIMGGSAALLLSSALAVNCYHYHHSGRYYGNELFDVDQDVARALAKIDLSDSPEAEKSDQRARVASCVEQRNHEMTWPLSAVDSAKVEKVCGDVRHATAKCIADNAPAVSPPYAPYDSAMKIHKNCLNGQ